MFKRNRKKTKINEINSYGINKKYNWKDIKSELKKTQRCYNKLKEYLSKIIRIDSQFINIRSLIVPKRAGSIMFNIV